LVQGEPQLFSQRLTSSRKGKRAPRGKWVEHVVYGSGEYDPLSHLEEAVALFAELGGPKELWVFENEFPRVSGKAGIAGLEIYPFLAVWLHDALMGRFARDHRKVVLVPQRSGAGPYSGTVPSVYVPDRERVDTGGRA